MGRSMLAALIALLTLVGTASAQLFPTGTPDAEPAPATPTERVLLDTTVWVNPSSSQGFCMALGAGKVTVTVRRENDDAVQRPTEFRFYGFVADQDAGMSLVVSAQESVASSRVLGLDHYCWHVNIKAPEAENLSNAERSRYVQRVAVKMTFQP